MKSKTETRPMSARDVKQLEERILHDLAVSPDRATAWLGKAERLIENTPVKKTRGRPGLARQGTSRTGEAGQARRGAAGSGKAGQGNAGQAGIGGAREGLVGSGSAGQARHGETLGELIESDPAGAASTGRAWRGGAGVGTAGGARGGKARSGQARAGEAGTARQANAVGAEITAIPPVEKVVISQPNFVRAEIKIRGISSYVQHAFSQKARLKMEETQRAGSRSRSKKAREARKFEDDYEAAKHKSEDGWCGIPASGFRNSLISACKVAGFVMTRAKLAVFVLADGVDALDGTPLVRFTSGEPIVHQSYARNDSGVADLRWRPMWREWTATLRLEWDGDMLSSTDVVNLVMRAGLQVGIGEGRPDSPNSNGLGWGRWEVVREA